jgi:Fe2+ or Zn2+ uptake regulation protein
MTVIERLIKRCRRESQKVTKERQKVVMRLADDECTAFLRLWAGGGAVE